jgi:N-acetylglucosaminyl-diphospho-decaprenol L-rhamnosyltransferase
MALVDVVVVSYNSSGTLRACLEPLARMDDIHVIVVDNDSADGSLESVADLPVTQVALRTNLGFAHGNNVGREHGDSPYVLMLNPDARTDGASIRGLVKTLERDPRAGLAAPRILEPDGTLHFSQRRFPRLRSSFAQALLLHRVFPRAAWADELVRDPAAYERPGSPEWVSGACMLLRRADLEALGGLDDGFFLYSEDTDLCRRLRDAGLATRFVPEALVVHAGGSSAPRAALLPVLAASRLRYVRKHHGPVSGALHRLAIVLGAVTHALVARGGRQVRAGHARAARLAATSGRV